MVREKSKIPISVSWEGGVEKYSGLREVAMEGGYVEKPFQVGTKKLVLKTKLEKKIL